MPRRHPDRDRSGRGRPPKRDDDRELGSSLEFEQRRRANCAAKDRYDSEAQARSFALMHTPGAGPRSKAYHCDVCDGWHLTRG